MELKSFGYEGYKISDDGRLWSEKTQKFLKPHLDKYGYIIYTISIDGKPITMTAHKMVALAFIPNPNNLPQINHKDENKINNKVENLEWCTSEYNNNYGSHNQNMSETKKEKGSTGKPVAMYDKNTGELLKTFVSASEAVRYVNGKAPGNILKCCEHKKWYKTAYGYKWEFCEVKEKGV